MDWIALRIRAGFTQARLAEQIGIDRSYLSRVERGERPMSLRLFRRWAKALALTERERQAALAALTEAAA